MSNWNECLFNLRKGDFSCWPKHEWIPSGNRHVSELTQTLGLPIWQGEEDVSLLVNADCGMGDTINYYRWLKDVNVKNIFLRCDDDLGYVLENQKIKTIPKESSHFMGATHVIHIMAVPNVLNINEITGAPYLSPKGMDKAQNFGTLNFTKIGICWTGNPFNPTDSKRSIPVEKFKEFKFLRPFGLVKHIKPPEYLIDARMFMSDWNETAHFINHMDLVISVDTAIAHLAGAMGKRVWLLISEDNDWRWGDSGNLTPWYDSMRIFRKNGNWSDLLENVNEEIKTLFE